MATDPPQLCIRIDPAAIKFYTPILTDQEREDAYIRARAGLKAEMEKLVVEHNWISHISDDQDLFHISRTNSSPWGLRLPLVFSSFLSPTHPNHYLPYVAFCPVVKRLSADKIELFVSENPAPLAKIFYTLQVIAPGMLMIAYGYHYDYKGKLEWSRVLPQSSWVQENRDMLVNILGSDSKYETVLKGSGTPFSRFGFYQDNGDRELERMWPYAMGGFPRLPPFLPVERAQTPNEMYLQFSPT